MNKNGLTRDRRYEKIGFLHMKKKQHKDNGADQRLCFRYTDNTIPLHPRQHN